MNNREKILKENDYNLTSSQYTAVVFGTMVGVSTISITKGIVRYAHQDLWISTAVGAIFPIYIFILTMVIFKKSPGENILTLNRKYFGKFAGGLLNLILLVYFLITLLIIGNTYIDMITTFSAGFLSPFKVALAVFAVSAYAASNGLRVVAKVSQIALYLTFLLILPSIMALKEAKIINIYPVFESGFSGIVNGGIEAFKQYLGIEIIFIIYPYLKQKDKMAKVTVNAILLTTLVHVWIGFISVYYLGSDVILKSDWSFLLVTESVTISLINNFRYIFILVWSLIILKSISLYYSALLFCLKDFTSNKFQYKILAFVVLPLLVLLCIEFENIFPTEEILNFITISYEIYLIFLGTLMAITVSIKSPKEQRKN
ncbi:GerAB/ArcD/ProY family transporter [Fervidicella metallireducens]|nr:GerAB/ArcD/ProY family transporter [Fervidicella metallireducens]